MPTFAQDFRYSLATHQKSGVRLDGDSLPGPGHRRNRLRLQRHLRRADASFSVCECVDRLANLSISEPRGDISDVWFSGSQLRELRNLHTL
jgi:hypothetical protein